MPDHLRRRFEIHLDRPDTKTFSPEDGTEYKEKTRSFIMAKRLIIALPFILLSIIFFRGASLFPEARFVFFALAGTGLFIATLILVLTPENTVPAHQYEQVYQSYSQIGSAVSNEPYVYVPKSPDHTDAETDGCVQLLITRGRAELLQKDSRPDSDSPYIDNGYGEERYIHPLGQSLFRDFESQLVGTFGSTPEEIAPQLSDALENGWELARRVEVTREQDNTYSFNVNGAICEPVDGFDHPIASFLGVGFTSGLDTPVRVTVTEGTEDNDQVITCTWENGESMTADDDDGNE